LLKTISLEARKLSSMGGTPTLTRDSHHYAGAQPERLSHHRLPYPACETTP